MDRLTRRHGAGGWTRWVLGALVGVLALTLVACSGDETETNIAPSLGRAGAVGTDSAGAGGATGARGAGEASSTAGDWDGAPPFAAGGGAVSPGAAPPSGPARDLQGTLDRTIIREGTVGLEVESVVQSFDRVRQTAEGAGGFVAESSLNGVGADQSATLTLRVPAARFGDVVAELQGLAVEVRNISSGTQDVTEEYTDLQSGLRNLRAVEERYLTLLSRAEAVEDILLVQDRLNGVRWEIERIQGRVNLLDNLSSLATVRVHLFPTPDAAQQAAGDPGFGSRVADAWSASLEAIEEVATTLAVALVWSWWLLPVVALTLWAARRLVQRLVQRRAEGATAPARVDTPEGAA